MLYTITKAAGLPCRLHYVACQSGLFFLYLFDPVHFSEDEREKLRMIQNDDFHSYLLDTQVKMSTIAAITQTAFVGNIDAVSSPIPKAIAVVQLFLRHLIYLTLYILRPTVENVTVEIRGDF